MLRCTVGVLAYNEEHNIQAILRALLNQRLRTSAILEIIVVASGCTDRTVELAGAIAATQPLIRVEVQAQRGGKAAAINRLIELARGDVIVLAGADTLPDPLALEHLLRPFANAEVGMTGARIVPLNDPRSFLGFAVQLLWQVHHRMALRWPKLGELVAFRNVIPAIPVESATDEVALEALITARGYRLAYAPDAIVFNRGPQTLADFIMQRRRIYTGHLAVALKQGYVAASMPLSHLWTLVRESLVRDHYWMLWLLGAMLLECWARTLGSLDFSRQHSPHIWRRVDSTKQVQPNSQPVRLVAIKYRAGTLRRADLMRSMRRIPHELGTLFWWDSEHKEVFFMLPAGQTTHGALLDQQIQALADYMRPQRPVPGGAVVSYRIIELTPPLPPSDDPPGRSSTPHPLRARRLPDLPRAQASRWNSA